MTEATSVQVMLDSLGCYLHQLCLGTRMYRNLKSNKTITCTRKQLPIASVPSKALELQPGAPSIDRQARRCRGKVVTGRSDMKSQSLGEPRGSPLCRPSQGTPPLSGPRRRRSWSSSSLSRKKTLKKPRSSSKRWTNCAKKACFVEIQA